MSVDAVTSVSLPLKIVHLLPEVQYERLTHALVLL